MNYIGEYRREKEIRKEAEASESRVQFLAVVAIAYMAVIWFYTTLTLQAVSALQ